MDENRLTEDILELRRLSSGKGIIYILFRDDGDTKRVSVFSPKKVLERNERDDLLGYIQKSSDFRGRIDKPNQVWRSILRNPWERSYYRFDFEDSHIEITTTNLSDILGNPTETLKTPLGQ